MKEPRRRFSPVIGAAVFSYPFWQNTRGGSYHAMIFCQAFLKMSRKKHFISPIFRGLKEGKSKAKSKNAFYRSSFNVSLL